MGCCVGRKNDALINKNIVVNIEQNENNDLTTSSNELSKDKDKTSKKSDSLKKSKFIQKNDEENKSPITIRVKNIKNIEDISAEKVRKTYKNLKLFTMDEVKNSHKFFS